MKLDRRLCRLGRVRFGQATVLAEKIRVRNLSSDEGSTVPMQIAASRVAITRGGGIAIQREPLCTAPCSTEVAYGTHPFAVQRPGGHTAGGYTGFVHRPARAH